MTDATEGARAGRLATGALLVACGTATAVTTIAPGIPGLPVVAVALLTASLLAWLLGTESVSSRRIGRAAVAAAGLTVAGPALTSVGSDRAVLAVPTAGAAILLWAALAWGRGGALQLAGPAAAAAGITWINGAPSVVPVAAQAVLPATLVGAEALAWLLTRARRSSRRAAAALADIDTLLIAALDLRGVSDVRTAGNRICRLGTELLDGDGALLYLQGPGRLVLGGRHGRHPAPIDPETGRDATLEAAVRLGAVRAGDPVLVPVTAAAGVVAVLAVSGARRRIDDLTSGMAQLFGNQAGGVLDRLRAVECLFDAATVDPVTGVGNRQQASSVVASLRPGDGLVVLTADEFDAFRAARGDAAADLLLGQLGLHLRNGTRTGDAVARLGDHQFVVALRALETPIDDIVRRLVRSWMAASPSRTISVGAALHLESSAPLETLDRANAALAAATRRGGGQAHVAPDFSVLAG